MSEFHVISSSQFSSLFNRIGKEWMLISASDGEHTNSMTASWGCFGVLWNRQVAVCFVRPQRYTFEMTEKAKTLSLAFFDKEMHPALSYMGTHSGRDGDKYLATGIHILKDENGTPFPAEARLVLLCRQLYAGRLEENAFLDRSIIPTCYPDADYHQMYICEIERVLLREDTAQDE